MTTTLTIEPVDVFMPRGNRLFGGGVHGESLMPPWPSVFAGALASRALADAGRVTAITRESDRAEAILAEVLGEDYALLALALAKDDEAYFPMPADLVALEGPAGEPPSLRAMSPRLLPDDCPELATSGELPWLPMLGTSSRAKPLTGRWISSSGLAAHLRGETPDPACLTKIGCLWKIDHRLGIALDPSSRTAAEGQLYTSDAVVLANHVRFAAAFSGRNVPRAGLLRLGGDARGAQIGPASSALAHTLQGLGAPQPGWRGFRMILATPGLFPDGWLPPGIKQVGGRKVLELQGLTAELVAAAVPRHEVVSGWDLAKHAPKPARKVAPTGSCYWFRVLQGDSTALASLRQEGLWPLMDENAEDYRARRREGFNRVWFGAWQPEED